MPTIHCDICHASTRATPKAIYDLEKAGFEVYCHICAAKLCINKVNALEQGIKVYKMK